MKRILVTGGSGFIGSHTCLVLLENNFDIVVIDSYINSSPISLKQVNTLFRSNNPNFLNKINLIKGDIRDEGLLNKIFHESQDKNKPIEAVIHFAGLKSVSESVSNPLLYWDNNVGGSINLLKSMEKHGCKLIVFSSSATIYGHNEKASITEDYTIKPINPYGKTKASVENLLRDLSKKSGDWRIVNLRYFNPIGAHPSGLIGENPLGIPNNIFPLINQVASGRKKELQIYGDDWPTPDGTGIRDYVHVMDLAEGHVLALNLLLESKIKSLDINLGTGKGTSVLELVNTFQYTNNIKIPYSICPRRPGDVASAVADNSLALSILSWKPKRNLEDMCRDGWSWQKLNPNGYFTSLRKV